MIMEYQSRTMKPNPNPKSNHTNQKHSDPDEKNEKKKKQNCEFEFCKVCKLNHDQGQRHKYFPNHTKSLTAFLAQIQTKIADIRFFLKNPSVLRPEHASHNRFWCVFCDESIDELGSSFACGNAINHLANANHLKNLKHFLWQYGGEMDHIDTFRIFEADVAKWEKKCQSLKSEAASSGQRSHGLLYGLSNVNRVSQQSLLSSSRLCSSGGYHGNQEVSQDERKANGDSAFLGLQSITQVTSLSSAESGGNVHSGAPPPWFEPTDENFLNSQLKPALSRCASPANKSGKSHKLNPKRVGATWADKRKMEMELEMRGETVKSDCDTNWLPNFGRVWQSGSRKESRKEFENEKQKLLKVESNSEMPMKIQPYISKRMRRDVGEC